MVGRYRTLVQALAEVPRRPGRGFTFVGSDRTKRFYAYEELWQQALARGAVLRSWGLEPGDRVALVIPEGHEFVLTFLGAVVAGVVPVPIFPRATFKAVDAYAEVLAHIIGTSGSRVVVTMESTRPFVDKTKELGVAVDRVELCETAFQDSAEGPHHQGFRPAEVKGNDLCFLQFTSGSTSKPKGVQVTHANLVANATAFLGPHGLDRRDEDVGVSWLPLYHDMGLIGFILGTLICDIPVVVLPTATFARTPRIWLDTIHEYRGTITFAPNFAYTLVAKRLRDRDIEQLDLSCLRVAGCGAEPIRAQTLRDFAARLKPAGFSEQAYLPSYGLAEATLAVTFHPHGSPLKVDRVDATAMKKGYAQPASESDEAALELVSCGKPFPGHELTILGEDGSPRAEREVGEIVVQGPSITSGYYENTSATAEALRDGKLYTGDLGYLAGSYLYVCGRKKDLIIINGANHYPQDIEWAVGELEGVRRGNVVALGVMRDGIEQLCIVAEGHSKDAETLRKAITQRVGEHFGLQPAEVAIVPVGTLPKTSSGKAQRRKTHDLFEAGQLPRHP